MNKTRTGSFLCYGNKSFSTMKIVSHSFSLRRLIAKENFCIFPANFINLRACFSESEFPSRSEKQKQFSSILWKNFHYKFYDGIFVVGDWGEKKEQKFFPKRLFFVFLGNN